MVGELLSSYADIPECLSQDILQVRLPNLVTIDVGWAPRFDFAGSFVITVARGRDWDNQLINPVKLKDPYEVAVFVEQLAEEYFPSRQMGRVIRRVSTVNETEEVDLRRYRGALLATA